MDIAQSLAFAGAFLLMALGLYQQRPVEGLASRWAIIARSFVLAALLLTLATCAQRNERGEGLRLTVERLQVPISRILRTGPQDIGPQDMSADKLASPESAFLIVGDRLIGSDLAVTPYGTDAERNQAVQDDLSRPLVVLHGARADGDGEGNRKVRAWVCLHGYAADRSLGLPGWHVVAERNGDEIAKVGAEEPVAGQNERSAVETNCTIALTPGEKEIRIRIFRSEYVEDAQTFEQTFKPDSQERREVFVSWRQAGEDGALSLRFNPKTTPVADLGTCRHPVARLLPATTPDTATIVERSPDLPQIGAGGLHPLLDPADIGRPVDTASACAGHRALVAWPQGPAESAVVTGTVERHFLPWVSIGLVVLALLFFPAIRGEAWRSERAEGLAVTFLQVLVMLRALIGIAGIPNYGQVSRIEVIYDLSVANACLPTILIALLMRAGPDYRRIVAALGIFSFGVFAATLWWVQSSVGWLNWGFILFLTGAALFARWRNANPAPLLIQLFERLKAAPRHFSSWEWGANILIGTFIFRLLLRSVGWLLGEIGLTGFPFKDRVGGFALSIFYQPLLVIGFGCLIAGYFTAPRRTRWLVVVVLFAMAAIVTPICVSDSGIIFVFSFPLAVVAAWIGLARVGGKRHPALALPLLMLVIIVSGLSLLVQGRIESPRAPGNLAAHLEQTTSFWRTNDNLMRVTRFAAPGKVAQVGNKAALEALDQTVSMEPLGRELLGKGYMTPSNVRPPMVKYQYSDNLSSVHVMWPFGRLGAMALIVLFGAFAFGVLPRNGTPGPTSTLDPPLAARGPVAMMAAVTLVWSCIYMIGANLNLVPFVGKNIYLLAATSGADQIEGTIMVLLACIAALWTENRESDGS